jgi:hypothetical protein
LKTGGILDDEFLKQGVILFRTDTDACKAKGDDPDATEADAFVDEQAFESRCLCGNQVVQRELADGDGLKSELLKQGEVKPLDDVVRECAMSEGGDKEGGREAEGGRRRRLDLCKRPDVELLQIVQSGGPEPGVDGGFRDVEVEGIDAEAAAGSRVEGEDVGDDADAGGDGRELAVVEVERGGAPEVAPAGREGLGAGAILDGEEGNDVAEVVVIEEADAVVVRSGGRRSLRRPRIRQIWRSRCRGRWRQRHLPLL